MQTANWQRVLYGLGKALTHTKPPPKQNPASKEQPGPNHLQFTLTLARQTSCLSQNL